MAGFRQRGLWVDAGIPAPVETRETTAANSTAVEISTAEEAFNEILTLSKFRYSALAAFNI
jgi:hypothetical protein